MSVKRIGSVLRVKPEHFEEYKRLHADVWPGVLAQIKKANIRNYSIFEKDGYLFSYMEYVGTNYEADMAAIGEDEETRRWWSVVGPLQDPLPTRKEGEWWAEMEQVFFYDGNE